MMPCTNWTSFSEPRNVQTPASITRWLWMKYIPFLWSNSLVYLLFLRKCLSPKLRNLAFLCCCFVVFILHDAISRPPHQQCQQAEYVGDKTSWISGAFFWRRKQQTPGSWAFSRWVPNCLGATAASGTVTQRWEWHQVMWCNKMFTLFRDTWLWMRLCIMSWTYWIVHFWDAICELFLCVFFFFFFQIIWARSPLKQTL